MKDTSYTSILSCNSYDAEELASAVKKACDSSNFPNVTNKIVLLKPNILSDSKPESGVTTNPEFLRQVIKYIKTKNPAKIIVGDSPGLPGKNFIPKECGIYEVCKSENIEWVNFSSRQFLQKIPGTDSSLHITEYVNDSDIIISLPKFKTHELMYMTGAVKNMFGVVPGLHKSSCHLNYPSRDSFAHLIGGLYEFIKPDFAIMDAVIGMDGAGPANGNPIPISLIIASDNCAALDMVQAQLAGMKPEDLPIIKDLSKRHLIPSNRQFPLLKPEDNIIKNFNSVKIRKKTEFFKTLILPFFKKSHRNKMQKKETPPIFDMNKCIRCGRCVKICPAKALTLENNVINIDTNKCIRCYCCNEVCPQNAIEIKRN